MLYQNGNISVDSNFARFGSKSYAVAKINTVDVREHRPHGSAPVIIFGFLAMAFAWMGWLAIAAGGASSFFVIAAVCGSIAYWAYNRRKIVEYQLYLMTSSSEAQALKTRDGDAVAALRDAIETAMTGLRQHEMSVRFVRPEPEDGETADMKQATPSFRQRVLGAG